MQNLNLLISSIVLHEFEVPGHDWIIVAGDGNIIQDQIIENLLSQKMKVVTLWEKQLGRESYLNNLFIRYPENFFCFEVNMLSTESIKDRLAQIFKLQNGRFGMIYLSANLRLSGPMLELSIAHLDAMIEEDIKPFFNAMKAFVKSRKEWGYGSFLHVVNKNSFKDDEPLSLANIAAVTQMECIARISKEAACYGIAVAQLTVDMEEKVINTVHEEKYSRDLVEMISERAIELVRKPNGATEKVFESWCC